MSNFGYLKDIEHLKNKIRELEEQIESERLEHRDIYMKLKNNNDNAYVVGLKDEVSILRAENQRLMLRNHALEETISKTML